MSAPTMTSYISQTSNTAANTVDVSGVTVGSWMLAIFEIGGSSTIIPPSGWSVLLPISTPQTFGTRVFGVYGRIKQPGDTTFSWTVGTVFVNRLSVMWGTGGDAVTTWKIGTTGVRNGGNAVASQSVQAGTATTTVSPSIATSVNNCLVLALNMEATLATETGPSSYTGGTEWFWSTTTATYIESLHVLYNTQTTAGTVGAVTTTYPNSQVSNGAGLQIAIPFSTDMPQSTPQIAGIMKETTFSLSASAGELPYNITMPTGISVGDYIMIFLRLQSPTIVEHPTIPGFSLIGRTQSLSNATNRYNAIFGYAVNSIGDIPGSTVTVTIDQSTAGSNRAIAESVRLTNVDLTNPVVSNAGPPATGPSTKRPAYTSTIGALDIFYAASEFSASNDHIPTSYPSGYTEITNGGVNPTNGSLSASRTYMYVGAQTVTDASIPTATIAWAAPSGSDAEGISIRGKSAGLIPTGTALKNGNGSPIYLSYLDASLTRVTPKSVKIWLPGYPTVTDLLADIARHPTMAHRGGSSSYPEFSQYGYDHAVMNGFGVLEFSCGWTSDLVPFGLGGQYLDSAAGLAAGTNLDPTTITWATLSSTYVNKFLPIAPGVYQPFYRLADFLAKYTPTHVVCVDPKYGFATSSKVNAMLDICDANGGPSKIIIKFDSPVTDTTLTSAAHARGYKCMNYWGTDLTSLTAQRANWDILGYAYNAPPADWATITSYGKPTWAAIIPNIAGVTTATASGAGLMMVKDVVNIAPVSYWNE